MKRLEDEIAISTFQTGESLATNHVTMSIRHLPTGITVNGEIKGGLPHRLRARLIEELKAKVARSSLVVKQ